MVTSRGSWFLFVVCVLLALGVLASRAALALLALLLLLWFLGEGICFAIRSRVIARGLTCSRSLSDGKASVHTLWAGRTVQVRVAVRLQGWLGLPYVRVADRLPFAAEQTGGVSQAEGPLRAERPLEIQYEVRAPAVGRVRFEGVRVQLADYQGFFFHQTFIQDAVEYRVLPVLVDAGGHPATSKHHNLLPPPGVHRLRRPGTGSELLDLRDYLPGDPPKTIAWKVSARRDRLITKEFESEVPVRCTLFVDASNSVRVGPATQKALGGLVEIAAAAAQANAANRDLTGVCLFDEQRVLRLVRPARGSRHLAGVLNTLVDVAAEAPTGGKAAVDDLMQLAYPLAQEVYPELMRPAINQVPFWLPWLWPIPAQTRRRPSLLRQLYRPLFLLAALAWLMLGIVCYYASLGLLEPVLPPSWFPSPVLVDLMAFAGLFLAIPLLRRLYHFLPLVFSAHRRRLARWRVRLAAILSLRSGRGASGIGDLLEDDDQFAQGLQKFLAEHQVPYALPLYDAQGRYLFAAPGKVEVLARALLHAVGRGHDNELFVLLVDLLELSGQLDPLLRAVRVAVARHHQVVVICPWPRDLPPPGKQMASRRAPGIHGVLQHAAALRFQTSFREMRRTFARLHVPVVWAGREESIRLIVERMDRLRGVGRRR